MEDQGKRIKLPPTMTELTLEEETGAPYELLQLAEVRNAMNFAISHPVFAREMQKDRIWMFWMQRDLKIIMDALEDKLPQWITQNPEANKERPQWKVCYLWYRLIISAFQWTQIRFLMEYPDDRLIMYPPNSEITFVHLNVMRLVTPASDFVRPETMLLDFRLKYPQMHPILTGENELVKYTLRNLYNIRVEIKWSKFFNTKGYRDDYSVSRWDSSPNPIIQTCNALWIDITLWAKLYYYKRTTVPYTEKKIHYRVNWKIVADYPRALKFTHIIVGCAYCGHPAPGFKCNETRYCSKKCQIYDWPRFLKL